MGYCIEQKATDFFMKAEDKPKALEALKAIANDTDRMGGGSFSGGERTFHFSWCDMSYVNDTVFEKAFKKLRWETEEYQDDEGNIIDIEFYGEKLGGDEEYILNAIAPFVKAGSYIEMYGEDGNIWRWAFNGEKCEEIHPTITWED